MPEPAHRQVRLDPLPDAPAGSGHGADLRRGERIDHVLAYALDVTGSRLHDAAPTHLRGIRQYFLETVSPDDLAALERSLTAVARLACDDEPRREGAADAIGGRTRHCRGIPTDD